MLTIFSIPRAFDGYARLIQRNAIASWRALVPACEIVLFGDDAGVAEAAHDFGVRHEPHVDRNEFGTPLLDGVFARVQATSRFELFCYVNADIILLGDFISAVRAIQVERFLMIGRRWDVDIDVPVNVHAPGWENAMRVLAHSRGELYPAYGSDYFVFPRGAIGNVPPFAVGRPRWDNWMIFNARRRGMSVYDATPVVTAIHQNHERRHWPQAIDGSIPEEDANQALLGWKNIYGVEAATHRLTSRGPIAVAGPRSYAKHLVRSLLPEFLGGYPPRYKPERPPRYATRAIGG